jgi:hypothetical protein
LDEDNKRLEKKCDGKLHVLSAFLDKQRNPEELTWQQVKQRSGFSKGTFHNYFIELFEEDEIKGEVRAINHKLVNIYFLGHPETAGVYGYKQEEPEGGSLRIFLEKESHKPVAMQEGVMRPMKKTKYALGNGEDLKNNLVFCATQPPKPFERPKLKTITPSLPVAKTEDIDIAEDLKKMRQALNDARRRKGKQ